MGHDFEPRPDPLWMERRGRSRRQTLLILIVVLVAVYAAAVVIRPPVGCSLPGAGPCQSGPEIAATVRPITPLSRSACISELRRWHRGYSEAVDDCRQGRRRAWFKAVVTNTTGDRMAVLCDVHAFRASGERIGAEMPLPVYIVQEPGVMWLDGHQTRTVEWFFDPHDAPKHIRAAARFIARCRRNPSPPI